MTGWGRGGGTTDPVIGVLSLRFQFRLSIFHRPGCFGRNHDNYWWYANSVAGLLIAFDRYFVTTLLLPLSTLFVENAGVGFCFHFPVWCPSWYALAGRDAGWTGVMGVASTVLSNSRTDAF